MIKVKIIRSFVLFYFLLLVIPAAAQENGEKSLLRIYHDNDLFNFPAGESDDAYTAGLRLDIFFEKKHPSAFILDRILPKAGQSAVNIFQWGVMQVLYTPWDISDSAYQPNDYSFAGGLFLIHSLYSYNVEKKYDFQTEIHAGVMGPISLAEESQKLIHQIIHYQPPEGWNNQLKNDLLLNVNFTAEKEFFSSGKSLELIGGAKISAGTELNAATAYALLRVGIMKPYFEGYISQYSSAGANRKKKTGNKMQAYFFVKPAIQWVLTNALLEGGFFSSHSNDQDGKYFTYKSYRDLEHLVYSADFGAVLTRGHTAISFSQSLSSMQLKNTYYHNFGNISLYFGW
jgi:lipid A 3-O-deacylase